jgi:hypothetical protein
MPSFCSSSILARHDRFLYRTRVSPIPSEGMHRMSTMDPVGIVTSIVLPLGKDKKPVTSEFSLYEWSCISAPNPHGRKRNAPAPANLTRLLVRDTPSMAGIREKRKAAAKRRGKIDYAYRKLHRYSKYVNSCVFLAVPKVARSGMTVDGVWARAAADRTHQPRITARKCFIGVNIALSAGNAEFRHNLTSRQPASTYVHGLSNSAESQFRAGTDVCGGAAVGPYAYRAFTWYRRSTPPADSYHCKLYAPDYS